MAEVKNDDGWIKNDDGTHYCPRIDSNGYWIVGCLAPCFVCICHQHDLPYETIFEVINNIYLSEIRPRDLNSYTATTIENWEIIKNNIKG